MFGDSDSCLSVDLGVRGMPGFADRGQSHRVIQVERASLETSIESWNRAPGTDTAGMEASGEVRWGN